MPPDSPLDAPTLRPDQSRRSRTLGGDRILALTILWHPDPARVGECAFVPEDRAVAVRLSRLEPDFAAPRVAPATPAPISDPTVSRKPLTLRRDGTLLLLDPDPDGSLITVDGTPLTKAVALAPAMVDRGVVLIMAERVAMLLHRRQRPRKPRSDHGFTGDSAALQHLRCAIDAAAENDRPMLLVGEVGSGKAVAARAIHHSSERASGPMIAVNMVTLTAATAAEQFGHDRYSSPSARLPDREPAGRAAVGSERDLFAQASGGTLFLDEIDEAPLDVQAVLLRAIERHKSRLATGQHTADVRLIVATKADLEEAGRAGRFRTPLLPHISGECIEIPPLRHHRDDIPALLLHFLRDEFEHASEPDPLVPRQPGETMWLHPDLVAHLLSYHWPGNVRELRGVARHMVSANRGSPVVQFDRFLQKLVGSVT